MSPQQDPHGRLSPPRLSIVEVTVCYAHAALLALALARETLLYAVAVPARGVGALVYAVLLGPLCAEQPPTWERERAALSAEYS